MTAEAIGTALLLAAAVGAGIMAQRLAGGSAAIPLLANTIATGGALVAILLAVGPISGAHRNLMPFWKTIAQAVVATAEVSRAQDPIRPAARP